MAATIHDVAKLAGVHYSTVSRVQNGKAKITQETKEKIYSAMKQLDYHPNSVARNLANGLSGAIGVVVDAKFKTFGCGSAIATSSMATEMIIGKTLDEALSLTNKAVAEALDGLPPVKMHCSLLAEQSVKAAIKYYYEQNGGIPEDKKHLFDVLQEDEHSV